MACLRCGAADAVGGLCAGDADAIASATDITAEQIVHHSVSGSVATLVDQWGATHPIGRVTAIGRSTECDLSVLHHSVSALHAEINVRESGVYLRDRGSLNGSWVNGEKTQAARLFDGDQVRFGDVSFYFLASAMPALAPDRGAGGTVPTPGEQLALAARVQVADREVELVELGEGSGIARWNGGEVDFGRLEFGLLRLLALRRASAVDPVRAFVASAELARALDFNSVAADGENVRELVRRVRRKIKGAGLADLIESRKGAGYRLAWPVRN